MVLMCLGVLYGWFNKKHLSFRKLHEEIRQMSVIEWIKTYNDDELKRFLADPNAVLAWKIVVTAYFEAMGQFEKRCVIQETNWFFI